MNNLFILGAPRSGTSLFRIILNQNSNAVVPPECGFAHWLYGMYNEWSLSDSLSLGKVDTFIADLMGCRKFETWGVTAVEVRESILKNKPSNYSELVNSVYLSYKDGETLLIGDKNNYYINHLEDLMSIHKDPLLVHIVRDGRDVACSYKAIERLVTNSKFKPVLPSAIEKIAEEWKRNVENIEAYVKAHGGITVRYEDLIQDTQNELERVCLYLQLEVEKGMFEYYKNNDEPEETMAWKKKTLLPLDADNIGKYKKELTSDEVGLFEELVGETLVQFNYDAAIS